MKPRPPTETSSEGTPTIRRSTTISAMSTAFERIGLKPRRPSRRRSSCSRTSRGWPPLSPRSIKSRASPRRPSKSWLMPRAANPNDARAQFNLATFALNTGRSEQAIAAFRKAIAADPSLAEAYYHLGTLMVGQNKVPEAVQYLRKYLSMSPANAQNAATARNLLATLRPHVETKK